MAHATTKVSEGAVGPPRSNGPVQGSAQLHTSCCGRVFYGVDRHGSLVSLQVENGRIKKAGLPRWRTARSLHTAWGDGSRGNKVVSGRKPRVLPKGNGGMIVRMVTRGRDDSVEAALRARQYSEVGRRTLPESIENRAVAHRR